MEGVGDGGAALDQHLEVPLGAELVEQRRRGRRRARGRAGPWRRRARGRAPPATGRPGRRGVAHGQRRVVGPHGAGADDDGVALGPEAVGVGPGGSDPVIHWLRAVGRGGAPVEGRGQLEHDVGAAGVPVVQVGRSRSAASSAATPTSTVDAGGPQRVRSPGRPPGGRGPRWRRRPGPTPAATSASAHGGVRPWCEQGSRVTHAVAPRRSCAPGRVEGDDLGVRAAHRVRWRPRTRCRPRPRSRSRPTGWGGSTPARTRRARGLGPCAGCRLRRSCRLRGLRGRARERRPRPTGVGHVPSSLPSGLSPSAPGSHRIGRPTGCEEVRGLHRRSGLPPNPARALLSCAVSVQLERVLVPVTFVLVGAVPGQQLEGVGHDVEHGVEGLDAPLRRARAC